jgi:hypothetical protein
MSLSLEPVHRFPPGTSQSCAPSRIASWLAKRSQSTFLVPTLIATQRSGRIAEGTSHVVLICPALVDEVNHRMSFGHSVCNCVMPHGDPRHNHHSMAVLCADLTTVVNRAQLRWITRLGEQVLRYGGHTWPPYTELSKKRTVLGSSSAASVLARKPKRIRQLCKTYVRSSGFTNVCGISNLICCSWR